MKYEYEATDKIPDITNSESYAKKENILAEGFRPFHPMICRMYSEWDVRECKEGIEANIVTYAKSTFYFLDNLFFSYCQRSPS